MIVDRNKGITGITYNHLNLPVNVTLAGGTINYTYDAAGNKLRKVANSTTTDYAGNYKYENGTLQFFNHAEGYVSPKNTNDISQGFNYIYQYKDHLGNVRLSYSDNNNDGVITASSDPNTNEIIEESNYYPFGLKQKGYNGAYNPIGNSLAQKWGYNGKEFNQELGLNLYDYGARNYDPAIGRWFVVDALADDEMQVDKSPYSYAWNRPTEVTDPDGNCPWCIGAVVGALTEYAVQASINLASGDSLGDALWNNIDGADVALAGVEGALTGGASVARRLVVRTGTEIASAAIDVNLNGETDVIGTENSTKTVAGVVSDATIGLALAEGGDKVAKKLSDISSDKALKSATSDVNAAAKNLDKANNIRATGNSSQAARGSSAKNANEAFKDFSKAKQTKEVTGVLNKTVGKVSEETVTRSVAIPVTGTTAVMQQFFQDTVIPVFNFEQ
ncbi:conserved hypothetical protein [Tenacibaculum sediminilitoris]